MRKSRLGLTLSLAVTLLITNSAFAQVSIPVTFSDLAQDFSASTEIDLSAASAAAWDQASAVPGNGVFDNDKWAVVFKYESVVIRTGATVTFDNHSSGAPVVWLVEGDVTIESGAVLDLEGKYGASGLVQPTEAGPGGFRGGLRKISTYVVNSGGYGPGGGVYTDGDAGCAGSYATLGGLPSGLSYSPSTYGNVQVLPLIGGSGGAGSRQTYFSNGGGGGGAILIVAQGTITVDGSITAEGGAAQSRGGGGSGGAIRLIAEELAGVGTLSAIGGTSPSGFTGGNGRIRLEANTVGHSWSILPRTSAFAPDVPLLIWPPDTAPTVQITSVASSAVPANPTGSTSLPDFTLVGTTGFEVFLQTVNAAATAVVELKLVRKHGADLVLPAVLDPPGQTGPILNWKTAEITPGDGVGVLQAKVVDL